MKKVTVEIPDDKDLIFVDGEPQLVDVAEQEKSAILQEIRKDLEQIYNRYKDRLRGKYSVYIDASFVAYHDGNRRQITHFVNSNISVNIKEQELNWHD